MKISTDFSPVIVTGANSQIGRFLLPALAAAGADAVAISRKPAPSWPAAGERVRWAQADINGKFAPDGVEKAASLVHLAGLWILPRLLDDMAALGVRRVIAFGSTSMFTKKDSSTSGERDVAEKLREAEAAISARCGQLGMEWTIFRPTMIYGAGMDRNVNTIARFAARFGFFPVIGGGRGLRQPVRAQDLAEACVNALQTPAAFGKSYNLGGGEVLEYRGMVEKIFEGLGKKPRIVNIPLPLFRLGIRLAASLPAYRGLTPDMADRMSRDQTADNSEAEKDFGYSPRKFEFDAQARGNL